MPLYTVISQDGTVSIETKAKIAEEITRIHTSVMKVPKNYVRVVFLSYPKGSGFTGGEQAPTATLNCVLRSGHTSEEKTDMLQQLWTMFQGLTAIAADPTRGAGLLARLPLAILTVALVVGAYLRCANLATLELSADEGA